MHPRKIVKQKTEEVTLYSNTCTTCSSTFRFIWTVTYYLLAIQAWIHTGFLPFFITNILLLKKLSKLKSGQYPIWMIWTSRRGIKGVKIQNLALRSLQRSFRKSVSIYPRSAPAIVRCIKSSLVFASIVPLITFFRIYLLVAFESKINNISQHLLIHLCLRFFTSTWATSITWYKMFSRSLFILHHPNSCPQQLLVQL